MKDDRMNFCACDNCGKDISECDSSCPKFAFNANAVQMLLKQTETIESLMKELQEAQEQVKVLREALMRLDAGYSGMFGNQSISAKDESWIMAPTIVREALAKLEGK